MYRGIPNTIIGGKKNKLRIQLKMMCSLTTSKNNFIDTFFQLSIAHFFKFQALTRIFDNRLLDDAIIWGAVFSGNGTHCLLGLPFGRFRCCRHIWSITSDLVVWYTKLLIWMLLRDATTNCRLISALLEAF